MLIFFSISSNTKEIYKKSFCSFQVFSNQIVELPEEKSKIKLLFFI